MEYADVLQENNTIVVTSGQVLVDGEAVKLTVKNYSKYLSCKNFDAFKDLQNFWRTTTASLMQSRISKITRRLLLT